MLLRLDAVSLAFGDRALLDHASLQLDNGERLCLVGRNGEGKSSLLRVLAAQHSADDGQVWRQPGVRVALLAQDLLPSDTEASSTIADIVASGVPEIEAALAR